VQEALATIAGHTFAMEATRQLLLAELGRGEPPAVAGAIVKYNLTERCRAVVDRAMDIYAGAGLCLGPRNLIGEIARFPRVGVTMQGANLLVRNRITFGLGVIRCHPCLRAEIDALSMRGREAIVAFDKAFARHLRHAAGNLVRTVLLGLTGARLAAAPRGSRPNGRHYRQLSRLAAGFALTTDVVLFSLRGELRHRERLAGRMADVLSELYIASAVLRHHATSGGRETGDRALLDWALRDSLVRAEEALEGVCQNLPGFWLGRILRRLLFPLGRAWRPVTDDVERRLAEMLTVPSTARDRLTAGIFQPLAKDEPLVRLEAALGKLAMTAELEAKLRAGSELELLGAGRFESRIERAVATRLLSPAEGDELLAAEAARREALRVDEFPPGHYPAAGDE
jgi:acyl-CoA dehydrogenase